LIKSFGKSEHGCYDHKTSRNITCYADMREIFVWRGLVVYRWRELGLERRRRNRGGEGRWSGHILTFIDGFTDGICRWNRRWFWRNNQHVTARKYKRRSLLRRWFCRQYKRRSLYGLSFWIRRWFRLKK